VAFDLIDNSIDALDFGGDDVIIVSDEIQVEWLVRNAGPSLRRAFFCPISLRAYAAVLKLGWAETRCYFESADLGVCSGRVRSEILDSARTWLKELGLVIKVDGIDLAALDSSCQFLLFIHSIYVERTARNLLSGFSPSRRINLVSAAEPTPLDFYFDSDVSSAILAYVSETLGWHPRILRMQGREQYVFADHKSRPTLIREADGQFPREIGREAKARRFGPTPYRVGFVSATAANPECFIEALRQLQCETTVFPSAWSSPGEGAQSSSVEKLCALTGDDGPWSERIAGRLSDLLTQIRMRRSHSTLPDCIIRNHHLDFQWDYVVRIRWLGYANMIKRAQSLIKVVSPDLLIHSDHFTVEAAILSALCRRRGARVLVTLHSGWPVDPDWALLDPSDLGITPSHSAAERLKQLSGISRVFVKGRELSQQYQSLRRLRERPALLDRKRKAVGDLKLILLVTNALELNSVPFLDLASHFRTLSVLCTIPDALTSQVFVALRAKPGRFGEDPVLLRELCGFSTEELSLTEGLTFAECVTVADCVVGVNMATSGYFEVLEQNVPLLHVQTAKCAFLHPKLPTHVVPVVTRDEEIWPALESILFEPAVNAKIRGIQREFASRDGGSSLAYDGSSIEKVLREIRRSDWGWQLRRALAYVTNCPLTKSEDMLLRKFEQHPQPLDSQNEAGFVDDILLGPQGRYVLIGWAADLKAREPALSVHAFLHEQRIATCSLAHFRHDVAQVHNDINLTMVGFSLPFELQESSDLRFVSVYAELRGGRLVRLRDQLLTVEIAG
jgi:hypothetical protein